MMFSFCRIPSLRYDFSPMRTCLYDEGLLPYNCYSNYRAVKTKKRFEKLFCRVKLSRYCCLGTNGGFLEGIVTSWCFDESIFEERSDDLLWGIERVVSFEFFLEQGCKSSARYFVLRMGKNEFYCFGAERAEGAFKPALLMVMAATLVDAFVFEHSGAVVEKRVVPFSSACAWVLRIYAYA